MLDLALFCSAVMSDNLATRFYWSKWLTFSFATLLQLSSGLGYTFSIYSNDLKRHFKCVLLVPDVTVPFAHKAAGKTSNRSTPLYVHAAGTSSRQQRSGQHATWAATSRCLLACSTTA
jgi:hypothetical protein